MPDIAAALSFMRKLIAPLLVLGSVAQAAAPGGVVDLTVPGQLDALRDRRPEHFVKVQAILALARTRPAESTGQWIETQFGASEVELLQWRVTDPPRLRVSFILDDTRYTGEVVPVLAPVRAMPAR
jgi:hypothetical protein